MMMFKTLPGDLRRRARAAAASAYVQTGSAS